MNLRGLRCVGSPRRMEPVVVGVEAMVVKPIRMTNAIRYISSTPLHLSTYAINIALLKCHMRGHWASACPNEAPGPKRARSFGSGAGNAIRCFKCDKEGHFSNACPGQSSAPRGRSKSTSTSRGGKGSRGGRGSTKGKRGRGSSKSTFGAADGY
ncbi:hypothetical protein BDN71DRAFT_1273017 [Pleurotus eryngii]|uniref:CCHC-type domain-containing protein n=1 Tax=Pleurotus eryngii TaxID=5323 RepID=A0A9P5ZQ55_PLEER|nr:hypothetical protein BDN71DRAFT_1273017 [Pleurotus eryngii]